MLASKDSLLVEKLYKITGVETVMDNLGSTINFGDVVDMNYGMGEDLFLVTENGLIKVSDVSGKRKWTDGDFD